MLVLEHNVMAVRGEEAVGERRRGLRLRQRRAVKVFGAGCGKYFAGATEDISSAGLRIELPFSTPLQEGDLIHIHVGAAENGLALAHRRQMMPARVVWTDRDASGRHGRLVVGLEFVASVESRMAA